MTVQDLVNLPKGAIITAGQLNKEVEKLCIQAGFVDIGESQFGALYGKKYEKQF